jgi:hypothetical protein
MSGNERSEGEMPSNPLRAAEFSGGRGKVHGEIERRSRGEGRGTHNEGPRARAVTVGCDGRHRSRVNG